MADLYLLSEAFAHNDEYEAYDLTGRVRLFFWKGEQVSSGKRPKESVDVGLRKEVFARFGAAAYYAQCVEVELILARLCLARRGDSEPTAEEWQRIETEKRTMGGLLQFLRSQVKFDEEETHLLSNCIRDRNFLAHDYWYRRSSLLATPSGCEKLIAELQEICERLQKANATAEMISKRVRAQVGIAEVVVRQLQDDFVRRLQQGESEDAIIEGQAKYLQGLRAQ
jgi:hypothetical protein